MWLTVSALLVVASLEAAFQQFGAFVPAPYRTGPIIEPDASLGWRNASGTSQWLRRPEYMTRISINPQGRPGPEIAAAPAPDVRRIWLLGDSYAAGTNVAYERSIASLLPMELRDIGPAEVVNDAVIGYGLDQELLVFERGVESIGAHVSVVVFSVANDIWNVDRSLELRAPTGAKPYFELDGNDQLRLRDTDRLAGPPEDPIGKALARSALVNVIRSGLVEPFLARGLRREQLDVLSGPVGPWERAYRLTERLLDRLGAASRSAGIEVILVLNPDPCQLYADACRGADWLAASRVPQERLAPVARQAGLRVLDLLPVFADHYARTGERLYYQQDLHWDERGHAVAARAVAAEIRASLR